MLPKSMGGGAILFRADSGGEEVIKASCVAPCGRHREGQQRSVREKYVGRDEDYVRDLCMP